MAQAWTTSDAEPHITVGNKKTANMQGYHGAEFIIGLVLIWIALPMVWMNERKQVRIYDLIDLAKKKVVNVDIDEVESKNNYELVHATGKTFTL